VTLTALGSIAPDGSAVVVLARSGASSGAGWPLDCAKLYDATTGAARGSLGCDVIDAAFHPERAEVVVTTGSGATRVHDARTARVLHRWPPAVVSGAPLESPSVSFEGRGDVALLHVSALGAYLDVETGRAGPGLVDDPDVEARNDGLWSKRSGRLLDRSYPVYLGLSATWNDVRWRSHVETRGDLFRYDSTVWDLVTGRCVSSFGTTDGLEGVTWSDAGIAARTSYGDVVRWSAGAGGIRVERVAAPKSASGWPRKVTSPNGRWVASVEDGRRLVLADAARGAVLAEIVLIDADDASIAVAPDGRVELLGNSEAGRAALDCWVGDARVAPDACATRVTAGLVHPLLAPRR
jgi:hypothetical protein